jgi:HD-GYP domain-containing protein (c-di-GMP phosphodiesterase class II)
VPIASRVVQIAEFVEVAHRTGGVADAREVVRRQSGRQFDPSLAALLVAEADPVLSGLDSTGTWAAVIESEPALAVELTDDQLDSVLVAIANFVDLKSPYSLGHSVAVAELAGAAAEQLGDGREQAQKLRRVGLVHELGRLGVPNSILDKPGPLGPGEWERVKMSPYLTERMLHQSAALKPLGDIAVQHRERVDGSGYPRGISGVALSRPARIFAAADVYQAMRELRPHRPARSAGDAEREIQAEVRAGRLDADAVNGVLAAAGHRVPRRRESVSGLTAREIDVLRLLTRGLSNKAIADRLVISPKTVGNHIEHAYSKIDASNRAAASLFAIKHGLLATDELEATRD